jgi:hypothetical protein
MTQGLRGKSWLGIASLLAPALHAQESAGEPPTAASIFDRYVAVTGGQAAYDRIRNQITAITLTRDGQVLEHDTVYQTRSGDFRMIEVAGDRTTEIGVNDGVVWRKTPKSAELLEAEGERGTVLRDAVLLTLGQWRRLYTEAVWETGATIDGKACDQVAATPFIGQLQRLYFDVKSGLLWKQDVVEPQGNAEFRYEDYFDAGGVRIARRQVVAIAGVTFVETVDSAQFNQPIPASTFDLPAEIARLLQKKLGR